MEMLHIRLQSDKHKLLKMHCALSGVSMTSLIGDLIEKFLLETKGTRN